MRTCYSGPGSECQCVDRSELIGAIMDAEAKLVEIEEALHSRQSKDWIISQILCILKRGQL